MKAVVARAVGEVDVLEYVDVPEPVAGPGQVLLEIQASGVCFHDVINRRGGFPRTEFPSILGHEIAGRVAAVGAGARGFDIGDRVATIQVQPCGACRLCRDGRESLCRAGAGFFGEETPGGYADRVVAETTSLVPVPDDVDMNVASFLACAVGTALHAIRTRAQLQVGESVLITGASGGVGAHAVQLARLAGARVIAVTTSAEKVRQLEELGADDVIVSPALDFASEVKALTDGAGVEAVLEIVGASTFPASVRSLRPGGRLVFVGNVTADPVTVAPAMTILKEITIMGSDACTRQELADTIELVRRGAIRPVVDRVLPLADAAKAHVALENCEVSGRIVLTP